MTKLITGEAAVLAFLADLAAQENLTKTTSHYRSCEGWDLTEMACKFLESRRGGRFRSITIDWTRIR